ncbi:MAG: HPP family protein [Rhodocyclaceae bacterium]|nr:HPP family protein [Rhodocyclaceae bacterium]
MPDADARSAHREILTGKSVTQQTAKSVPARLGHFLGFPAAAQHRSERWAAALGALLGVAVVVALTHALLGRDAAVFVVPSLGATAVLVFAAPHSLFAQPWSVLAGNLLAALVGVACQRWLPEPTLAAAAAVALSIAVMHAARCIHPPGGATALAAVIGGPEIHQLGFAYALFPVGVNCLLLIAAGIAWNYPFAWRRYPASLMRYVHVEAGHGADDALPDERHVRQAMARLNVVVDVAPEELQEVIEQSLALAREERGVPPPGFAVGRCYGGRKSGRHWSVRQIVDRHAGERPEQDVLVYRVVDGKGRHRLGSCTRAEFARWAGRELRPRKATG